MKIKREVILIIVFFMILVLPIFVTRYVGHVTKTTPSRVSIDLGIKVYTNNFDGSTTDFLRMTDEELENISSMTLEITSYGKILFFENINLTPDAIDEIVDLDSNTKILHNFIKINTTALTSLEKPATLYLYGLTFNNPRILRNREICSNLICQKVSYSDGIFVFNVTKFNSANYSVEETLEETPSVPVSLSIGGGKFIKESSFSLNKDLIKVLIKQGELKKETIEITNTGDVDLNISIELENVNNFMVLSEESFILEIGKRKIVNLNISTKENEISNAYTGGIIIRGNGIEKRINVIIEVKEKKPLFDIKTKVIDKQVIQGEKVKANILIINIGDLRNIDFFLYTAIKDFEGNIITFKDESIAIDKELSLIRELYIPKNILDGQYIFYSKVSYGDTIATSTDVFEVKSKEKPYIKFLIIFAGILILIIIILFLYLLKKKELG
jgi:hypothetical protein